MSAVTAIAPTFEILVGARIVGGMAHGLFWAVMGAYSGYLVPKEYLGRAVAITTGGHTGVKTDAALMARLPKLKVIGNFGVGYDSIDVAAASKRGVVVTNTPDVLTEEVADTALGLLKAAGTARLMTASSIIEL